MNTESSKPTNAAFDIVCLSHLAWEETLFQRPQQIMLRMAHRGHRVLYAGCVGLRPFLKLKRKQGAYTDLPHLEGALNYVNLPYSPMARKAAHLRLALTAHTLKRQARHLFGSPGIAGRPAVLWIYHPGLLPLGEVFPSSLLVYDIMDRFVSFSTSSPEVTEQEKRCIREADIVFTGGRSLHIAAQENLKQAGLPPGKPPVHCFASGVELPHFARARVPLPLPEDIQAFPRPILGYFGAVDERIDFELLETLCRAYPAGSVVLIGPVLAQPATLPPNLHLMGARPYAQLPDYLRAFDVCLLPFRTTELVAHVSPTKTPEYLAGGKPVVSTSIPDVIADYGDIVRIAPDAKAFVEACRQVIASPPAPEGLAQEALRRARSWDQIAEQMEQIVSQDL